VAAVIAILVVVGLKARGNSSPGPAEASSAPAKGGGKDGRAKEKEPASVAVAAVEVGPISAYTAATANLVAEDDVKVVAEAEGKVTKLLVEEGDSVAAGQTLLHIDPSDAALAVDKAELALRNAELNLERSQRMAAEKLVSPQDLDKIRYERDVAAHGLAEARHRLKKTTVAASFTGRITLRKVQTGQAVKVGDELFTLADFDPLVARIFLPEREVLDLKEGQEVRLALRAREETRFAGRIRQISPVVDAASGTVKVTVEAVNPPAAVRPGAFVSVEVLRETRAQALLVPRQAVIRELNEAYVFVADGKVARRRPVEIGLEEGTRIEVTSGLKAGEQVITAGQGALKDQAPIAIAATAPTPVHS
jgi:membrane fusion protein (multidrug efflux system)